MSLSNRLMEQISNGLNDDDATHSLVATLGLYIVTEVKVFKELIASQSHELEQLNKGVKTLQEKTNALEKKTGWITTLWEARSIHWLFRQNKQSWSREKTKSAIYWEEPSKAA